MPTHAMIRPFLSLYTHTRTHAQSLSCILNINTLTVHPHIHLHCLATDVVSSTVTQHTDRTVVCVSVAALCWE